MQNRPLPLPPAEERHPDAIQLGSMSGLKPTLGPQPEQPRYLLALRHRWWLLLIGAVLGMVGGVAHVLVKVPTYQSSATLEIAGLYDNFVRTKQLDPQGTVVDLQEQFGIISSANLLNHAAERLRSETSPVAPPSTSIVSRLRLRLGFIPADAAAFTRDAVNMAISSVMTRPLGSTHIFAISCTSTSAEIAAAAANSIAAEFIAQNQQFHSSSATRSAEWFAGQVAEAKRQMADADAKLQAFVKSQGIKFVLDQNTLDDSKLRTLQADLASMQADRIEKQSRYNLIKSSPSDSLPEILDDELLQSLKGHLITLRQQRAVLLATLMPEHYKVRRLDAEITETENSITRQKANIVKRVQNEYEAALQREKMTSGAYMSQSHALANQTDGALHYATLKQAVASSREYYDQLIGQYNTALQVAAVPVDNIRVIDPARPINLPASKPMREVVAGTFLGMMLAAGIVLALEFVRFRRLSHVCSAPGYGSIMLNVPELGVIPNLKVPPARARINRPRTLLGVNPNGEKPQWEQRSFIAESFRLVLASILAQKLDLQNTAIMLTSAAAGEGKTTVAAHLAAAMAETGRMVLLVDADVRRPRLHRVFGVAGEKGISDLLESQTPLTTAAVADHIVASPVPGLSILPSGVPAAHDAAGKIFFSDRLSLLFSQLRQMFDVLIVDTPPALTFSDARRIGRVTDGAILVVRAEKTSCESAQATASRLAADGIPVFGAVLNDFTPTAETLYSLVYQTYAKYALAGSN